MRKSVVIAFLTLAIPGSFFLGQTAQSQARANSARWEYKCLAGSKAAQWEKRAERNTDQFNQLGQKGWELVAIDSIMFCFKRPLR